MKMSDVLSQDEIKYREWLQLSLKDTEDNEKWNAVQEAVKQHDALVELNKELVEALENFLWSIAQSDDCDIPLGIVKEAGNAVKKAKELNND